MAVSQLWIDDARKKLFVVIFGAYKPEQAKQRLLALRDCLREKGYPCTYLVEDLTEPAREPQETDEAFILRKSEYWLERCDIGFLVFFCEGNNTGVGQELRHLCNILIDRIWRQTVLIEKRCYGSMLISGLLERYDPLLGQAFFVSDRDLCALAYGRFPDYIRKLYYNIRDRQRFW
jgi:hypothetical protein